MLTLSSVNLRTQGTKTVHAHGSAEYLGRFERSIVFFSSKNFGPYCEEEEAMDTLDQVDEVNIFHEADGMGY